MAGVRAVRAAAAALLLAASALAQRAREGEVVPVVVTNFPDTVRVEGRVAVEGPIDGTRLVTLTDVVVAPTRREETTRLVDAGTVVTRGFSAAVVSLLVEAKAPPSRPGDVGAVLLPDDEFVLRAFQEKGVFLLAEEVAAAAPASAVPYFAAKPVRFTVAYPRYRVLLYNGNDRAVSVTLHAYLTN